MFPRLYSFNWANLIAWFSFLLETLGNTCIAVVCFPDCGLINFATRIHSKKYGNIVNLRKAISRAARYRDDLDGNVINLSKHLLTKKQFKVLNKNFCPTPGYYNKKEVKIDIKNFENEIKLKSFFELKKQDKPNKNNNKFSDIPNIKPKSTWNPKKSSYH